VRRQRKTLPKKTDNAEVVGQPSHNDSEGTTRISTEDSTWGLENCPKSYVKYKGGHDGAIKNDYKYKALHQRA